MRIYIPILLITVLAVLVCDIEIRIRPVHAQSSPTVYLNGLSTREYGNPPIVIKGGEVIAFSCAGETCYVLSK